MPVRSVSLPSTWSNQVWRKLTVVGVINAYYTADFVKHELGEHQQFCMLIWAA